MLWVTSVLSLLWWVQMSDAKRQMNTKHFKKINIHNSVLKLFVLAWPFSSSLRRVLDKLFQIAVCLQLCDRLENSFSFLIQVYKVTDSPVWIGTTWPVCTEPWHQCFGMSYNADCEPGLITQHLCSRGWFGANPCCLIPKYCGKVFLEQNRLLDKAHSFGKRCLTTFEYPPNCKPNMTSPTVLNWRPLFWGLGCPITVIGLE